MSPRIATIANGTRNHTGRIEVSAPIGSPAMASLSFLDDPASSTPKTTRIAGAIAAPNVVQPTTPPERAERGR
ncbi:hypothetical protein GCM10025881_26220 [Pseudolysinimonas kribbensis]|uniref:Uncharacterized protein n=1 Tax=Pseudolysinimonas kribbensis TaxID=433641 RepID=A0ABQ6K5T4_9MICO|nr:hypothetical protein GCM10025881_26220 [Pseudolysinimonas kribbensis]